MAKANSDHDGSHLCVQTKICLEEGGLVMQENQDAEGYLAPRRIPRRAEIVIADTASFKQPRQSANKIWPNHPAVMSHLRSELHSTGRQPAAVPAVNQGYTACVNALFDWGAFL